MKANAAKAETFAANIIYVYDRQGNRVARLNLSERTYKMALSHDQKKMYGVSYPENKVIEFDIPNFE